LKKVMLVTGGSRGIGAAVARLAAGRGYDVCVNYAGNADAAKDVVRAIEGQGAKAVAVQGDVADESDVLRLFDTVDRELGRLDVLVNNAGVVDMPARVAEMTLARLQRMFGINLIGSFLCAREAVKRMSTRNGGKGGAIVNLSSAAARIGGAGEFVDYAASKGAIDTMTLGLAREVGVEGIRVSAVRPGLIVTDIHASGGDPDRPERMRELIPVKRTGSAEEVAEAILWLASDQASYSHGAILDVTGAR
jgi:NAD(P)-dependent dehydrogenase (short-subunit alcohol dehydrogenase family)